MRKLSILGLLSLAIVLEARPCRGQITHAGTGSTFPGDVARGQGVFLQGMGWYELNDAKAVAQNADTLMRLENWNREVQLAYRREYNAAVEQRNYRTKRAFEEAQRKHDDKEARLRTRPTAEDISRGDALNALLADLSDPAIGPYAWKGAQVALPEAISIKSLAMRFVPKTGSKGSDQLSKGLIALGRLDLERGWPEYIPKGVLATERSAYQAAYEQILKECLEGKLESTSVSRLDAAIRKLIERAGSEVPTDRGYRNAAVATFRGLAETTSIFDSSTYSYAREMIADTNKHEARTVGELLAFMRKYRLMFARADAAPGAGETYHQLYHLLGQQADELGLKPERPMTPKDRPGTTLDKAAIAGLLIVNSKSADADGIVTHLTRGQNISTSRQGSILKIDQFFGRQDLICTHPINRQLPATIDLSRITKDRSGRLVLFVKGYPRPQVDGTLIITRDGQTIVNKLISGAADWERFEVPFSRNALVLEHHAIDWRDEILIYDIQVEIRGD